MDSLAYNKQEQQFYDKFDSDIYAFTNQIEVNLNTLKPERDFVYQKINKICESIYLG
jgi:hypothetical protein